MTTLLSHHSLRQTLRARRRALSPQDQQIASQAIARHFMSLGLHLRYKHIGLYAAQDGEIDPSFLAHMLTSMHRDCYLPMLHPLGKNKIYFGHHHPGATTVKNRYGIDEPVGTRAILPQTLDLILMPLVGFDRDGNRLGMGGGYYDHSLSYLQARPKTQRLIGLAHHCQEIDALTTNPWDIPMSGVLTDKGYISAAR